MDIDLSNQQVNAKDSIEIWHNLFNKYLRLLKKIITVHRFKVQRSGLRTKKALKSQSPR
jgi:hypothetical protein